MSLRSLVSPAAQVLYVRRKLLLESGLEDPHPPNAALRLRFRLGGESDLRSFNREDHGYDEAARRFGLERLTAGDRLVICHAPSGIAFYAWVMFGQMDLGCRAYRPIPSDAIYTYKLFTVPGYRGQRICSAYYSWLRETLRSAPSLPEFPGGIRRIFAWVEKGNHPSIRSHVRSGFRPSGDIWHLQFLFHSYFLVKCDF